MHTPVYTRSLTYKRTVPPSLVVGLASERSRVDGDGDEVGKEEEREHMKAELRESREEARAAQATLEARIEEMMAPKPALDDEQLTA